MKTQILIGLLLCPLVSAQACEQIKDLTEIGQADLSVWGFSVYSARTLSCDGKKIEEAQSLPRPFALELTYARNIDQQDLLDNTREQWQRLGLYQERSEAWLEQLARFWPSVKKGDRLTLYVTPSGSSEFYFAEQPIGAVTDVEFSSTFLAIWLAQEASYPRARKKLMGDTQ
ncbi:chalcone isomerase family protein [Simiduia litorea]|uniref:chalcone isomerase family protein n=1 Tax=Simiduia litorea TaxID=1435348 RepID=UPI0036F3CDB7